MPIEYAKPLDLTSNVTLAGVFIYHTATINIAILSIWVLRYAGDGFAVIVHILVRHDGRGASEEFGVRSCLLPIKYAKPLNLASNMTLADVFIA